MPNTNPKDLYAEPFRDLGDSFILMILNTAAQPDVISFAGGLPNPISFPAEAIKESCSRIIDKYGPAVFQYSIVEGITLLRDFLADKYSKKLGVELTRDNVMITSGSQQALDIMAKILIDRGDGIIVENPSYLGAIQAFNMYLPTYYPVDLNDDGLDLEQLEAALQQERVKFVYLIPEFQNPTGLSYTEENRAAVSALLRKYNVILVEDDPYGELIFEGVHGSYVGMNNHENSVLLGTFSKSVTPGMRLGYMISLNKDLLKTAAKAKENLDLHSNIFSQYLIYDYMTNNDHQAHVDDIIDLYRSQANTMLEAMGRYFPRSVKYTRPRGGMFLWMTLPGNRSTLELFYKCVNEKKVAFVPGDPFYVRPPETVSSARINFTNATPEEIDTGVKAMAEAMRELWPEME